MATSVPPKSMKTAVLLPLLCLLAGANPSLTAAPRSAAAGGGRFLAPSNNRPYVSPLSPLLSNRLSDAQASSLNAQIQRERLTSTSGPRYEIVPPLNPDLRPKGPVPGYQVVRLGRGHFNRLRLVGTVAGIKGLMMLDTGANNSVLGDQAYRTLRLSAAYQLPKGLPRTVHLNGTNVPLVEAVGYTVGGSNLGSVPVCLLPQRYLLDPGTKEEKGQPYDGLLGQNILRHYNAIIDCGRLMLYLNVDPAKKLNLSGSFVRHGWTRVPMSDVGNDFAVPCVLNGRRYRLIVDTGTPFTSLDLNLVRQAQVASHELPLKGSLMGTDVKPVSLVEFDHLQIGSYTATGVHMTATEQSFGAFDARQSSAEEGPILGFLGGDLLAANAAVIDIGSKSLYLKHASSKVDKQER